MVFVERSGWIAAVKPWLLMGFLLREGVRFHSFNPISSLNKKTIKSYGFTASI
jgi:hypothetical protein